jgi:hypothetical protein
MTIPPTTLERLAEAELERLSLLSREDFLREQPDTNGNYYHILDLNGEPDAFIHGWRKGWHAALAHSDEVLMRLARAAEQLDIGRLHNIKAYDCDCEAICHKHCPACEMRAALTAFREATK